MRISARQLAQSLYELADGKSKTDIEKSVSDFAQYIYRNRKLKLADKIIEQFRKIYNREKNIAEAEAVTVSKLENQQIREVESYIKDKYGAREVVINNTVDENIKGGIILKIGDEVMDGSVRERLEKLRKILIS